MDNGHDRPQPTPEELEQRWGNIMAEDAKEMAEFEQTWGFKRLDQLADYYLKYADRLNKAFPNWSAMIERYKNLRPTSEAELGKLTDPYDRSGFLLNQARQIIQMYPLETKLIYQEERKTRSFAYLDSLLETSIGMYRLPNNGNPYEGDDLGVAALMRTEPLKKLALGAKTPNETRGILKRKLYPFR